jgi:hypothetical protein
VTGSRRELQAARILHYLHTAAPTERGFFLKRSPSLMGHEKNPQADLCGGDSLRQKMG